MLRPHTHPHTPLGHTEPTSSLCSRVLAVTSPLLLPSHARFLRLWDAFSYTRFSSGAFDSFEAIVAPTSQLPSCSPRQRHHAPPPPGTLAREGLHLPPPQPFNYKDRGGGLGGGGQVSGSNSHPPIERGGVGLLSLRLPLSARFVIARFRQVAFRQCSPMYIRSVCCAKSSLGPSPPPNTSCESLLLSLAREGASSAAGGRVDLDLDVLVDTAGEGRRLDWRRTKAAVLDRVRGRGLGVLAQGTGWGDAHVAEGRQRKVTRSG